MNSPLNGSLQKNLLQILSPGIYDYKESLKKIFHDSRGIFQLFREDLYGCMPAFFLNGLGGYSCPFFPCQLCKGRLMWKKLRYFEYMEDK